jgi:hypothetical protein
MVFESYWQSIIENSERQSEISMIIVCNQGALLLILLATASNGFLAIFID